MSIFQGIIISESLHDPAMLNDFTGLGVYVATNQETPGVPVWHLFKVAVEDGRLEAVRQKIAENMKYGWYAHFWNGETVYVCLTKRLFQLPQETEWSSPEYMAMKAYAVAHGVEERYLDLGIS